MLGMSGVPEQLLASHEGLNAVICRRISVCGVAMNLRFSWRCDVTLYILVEICRPFEGTNCLLLQGRMGRPRFNINIEDGGMTFRSSHHLPDYMVLPHPRIYYCPLT
jgi:hypothetical protein